MSDRNDFRYFLSTSHPDDTYIISSQFTFRQRRRSEKYFFEDGGHGGYLRFLNGTILASFELKVPRCFLPKFQMLFCSREKAYFFLFIYLQVTLGLSTEFRVNWPRGVGGVGFFKQIVDAAQRTTHDAQRTLANHYSLPTFFCSGELIYK